MEYAKGIGSQGINPASQMYSGAGYPTTLGNVKALEGAGSGARPGGGNRTVYPRGTEAVHGSVVQGVKDQAPDVRGTKPGKDILSSYGPERTIKR